MDNIGRCPLSFLAIQQPGISKFCESCEAQYLNELHFPPGSDDVEVGDEIWSDCKLVVPCDVKDLFRAMPKCIYCGGKFIG